MTKPLKEQKMKNYNKLKNHCKFMAYVMKIANIFIEKDIYSKKSFKIKRGKGS